MQASRRTLLFLLAFSFVITALPVIAQRMIDTVGGYGPGALAVNPVTNKIYVTTATYYPWPPHGEILVIDGTNDNTTIVAVDDLAQNVAVDSTRNKIYVACFKPGDPSSGSVTIIDGATLSTTTVRAGHGANGLAVNKVTNKIYVTNPMDDSVTVIDGATLATATLYVGKWMGPGFVAVNEVTNKIYVVDSYGFSVTVIDGTTLSATTVQVGQFPTYLAINQSTNKVFVANYGQGHGNTVTVIDGATLSATTVTVSVAPFDIAVNETTNQVYVSALQEDVLTTIDGATLSATAVPAGPGPASLRVDAVRNKIYVTNSGGAARMVTVIDGASYARTTVGVRPTPVTLAINPVTNRIYVSSYQDGSVSVIDGTPPTALQFIPVARCRLVDTRITGNPILGGTFQNFAIQDSCGIPVSAAAYSVNVTVVPQAPLGYLTVWPAGQQQPGISTLNSIDSRVKANASIVGAGIGEGGPVSVYATGTTDLVLDIDGYFAPVSGSTLAFYPLPPCRVADTRNPDSDLGGPFLPGLQERDFPILEATSCNIPSSAQAYSLNFTAVPHAPLGYLRVWPTGQPQPNVSTLNSETGTVVANAAMVQAGTDGKIAVFPTNETDLVIDINGYFAPAEPGGLSLYAVRPCRVLDTRLGIQAFSGTLSPPADVLDSPCDAYSLAQGYVMNATVVPQVPLGYLTFWADGQEQPSVSTLNAIDGTITSNMAIVPTNNGSINAYATNLTQLVLDISSYFAP